MNEVMHKVSIIVPIYNAEKYLNECILSIVNQTYKNIEIILVNDGSNDSSWDICQKYKDIDSRIMIINKKNSGAGKARYEGLKNATADYVCFVDSDDFLESNFVQIMLENLLEKDADLVECGYNVFKSNYQKRHLFFDQDCFFNRNEFVKNVVLETILDGKEAVVLWNKMYKKELLFQYVHHHSSNILEDYIFNMQYYVGVNRYAFVSLPLINYRITENSLSRRYNPDIFNELKTVIKIKEEYMQLMQIHDNVRSAHWYFSYLENYVTTIRGFKNTVRDLKKIMEDPLSIYYSKHYSKSLLSFMIRHKFYFLCLICINIKKLCIKIRKKIFSIKIKYKVKCS